MTLKYISGISITLPNQSQFDVRFVGDIRLSSEIILQNVLYVPNFRFNLLSVGALTRDTSLMIKFVGNYCLIQDKSSLKMIRKGDCWNGLYILQLPQTLHNAFSFVNTTVCMVSFPTWHAKVRHPSHKHLLALKDLLHINSIENMSFDPCLICPLAKQRHLSFVSHNNIAATVFDLVHYDIWGPYEFLTHAGFQYFLTLVDDFSRYTWMFLLRKKFDALTVVSWFFASLRHNLVNV